MFNGDEKRFKQLLYILLDNAIKYNKPEGKIRLDVRKIKQDLHICYRIRESAFPAKRSRIFSNGFIG